MQTTILLADNQDITRLGILSLLLKVGAADVPTREVFSHDELESALLAAEAPVVVIDTESFEMSDPKELLILFQKQPMARWILFQNDIDQQQLSAFAGMPSVSMLLKENSAEEIRTALKCVLHAERYLCHQISNRLLNRRLEEDNNHLTHTETEILRLIALGKTVKEIAAIRFSSAHTIVTHKKNIFRKLEVNNVYEATRYALRAGLIEANYYI
ncbi:MAG: response regulator transcription factor [Bacteroidales bacterium]|nr:response regulator transcription factor [Bacteroidales bacterium]